jgi:hypothetical protein
VGTVNNIKRETTNGEVSETTRFGNNAEDSFSINRIQNPRDQLEEVEKERH